MVSGVDAAASLGGLIIGGSGDGTLTIDSCAIVTTSDTVVVGQGGDGFGTLTLDGGSSSFVDGGDLLAGASGDGTVSMHGGATLEVNSGAVVIGAAADSSGAVTVAGADISLCISNHMTVGQSGDGTLDLQAGVTLDVNSGTATVGAAHGGCGEIYLAGTGSVFSAGQDMTVGATGDGAVKVGAGAGLTVAGSLDVGQPVGADGLGQRYGR
jgi:fibronectin-binding autotransporter adhesin